MTAAEVAAVVVGGAVGAVTRLLVGGAVRDRVAGRFPWGTLTVNVTGSLLLGVITGVALTRGLPGPVRAGLGAGLCGGYTTFSAFTLEVADLVGEGALAAAAAYVAASLVGAGAAAGAGLALTGAW